jgi:hypothetical protein
MNWQNHPAYQAFEEFLQSVVIERRSYITVGREALDFASGFQEIKARFVEAFDASDATFDDKAGQQFKNASANTRRVFANFEYLYAMPAGNISGPKKRSYALRWFSEPEVISGRQFFFTGDDCIANAGMWYLTNKYQELLSICRIFKALADDASIKTTADARDRIETLAYEGIYGKIDPKAEFFTENKCGAYHILLHLAKPDRYEAIVSENHKNRIVSVFAHVLAGETAPDRESQIRRIREKLYDSYGVPTDPDRKRRWFFYMDDVKPLWIDKKTKRDQQASSVTVEIREEETAAELEGEKEAVSGFRLRRSGLLVLKAKERDRFTCVACGFHYHDEIVQAHHLDPLSERKEPKKTKLEDLITLCPNCHYIAHFLLRKSAIYKRKAELLVGIRRGTARVGRD